MTKNQYKKSILKLFAGDYPFSSQYRDGRKMRKGRWYAVFPRIEKDVEEKLSFLDAVDELCVAGILSASLEKYRDGDKLKALYLENPEKLFKELGCEDPGTLTANIISRLKARQCVTEIEQKLKDAALTLLEAKHPIGVDNCNELLDILTLAGTSAEIAGRFTLRGLSIHLFNDSKHLERILKNADRFSQKVLGERLAGILGLERTFPETLFYGTCTFRFCKGNTWDLDSQAMGFPLDTIKHIAEVRWNNRKPAVLAIENKETFYVWSRFCKDFDAYLYTGGYCNTADKAMIGLLHSHGAAVRYFGDLDPEGLLIFQALFREYPFIGPFMMNEKIYARYCASGYDLTDAALRKLPAIEYPGFKPLAALMKREKKGVEQEIVGM